MERLQNREIVIKINDKEVKVSKPVMIGREIKALIRGPLEHMLVLVVGEPDEVAGGDDKPIADDDRVDLKDGMRFRLVNQAIFG